jgi:hypothetical protein
MARPYGLPNRVAGQVNCVLLDNRHRNHLLGDPGSALIRIPRCLPPLMPMSLVLMIASYGFGMDA